MGTHPSGDGVAWDSLEAIDVDQPHGKDYVTFNHMAIAVRKRISQEHSEFGDTTAGGIHKPGGCAILGMEITDDAGDPTALIVADGTYRGHGLVWDYEVETGANKGILWCATAAAGASTTGDWTVMKLHPDLQWGGGDVTWAGAHAFQGNVDMSDVDITGSLDVSGAVDVDASIDCSDIYANGDVSLSGTLKVATDFSLTGGMGIDGTENHFDEADFSAVNIDGTTSLLVACTSQSNGGVDMTADVTFQVDSDGFVNVLANSSATNQQLTLYIGAAANVTKSICVDKRVSSGGIAHVEGFIPQGWYFAVSESVNMKTAVIYWTAIGKGACVSI